MKTTKEQAKQEVAVYGNLLIERAVISDIKSTPARETTLYSFEVNDIRYPYTVDCDGIKELALVLTSMWSTYEKARYELGADLELAV